MRKFVKWTAIAVVGLLIIGGLGAAVGGGSESTKADAPVATQAEPKAKQPKAPKPIETTAQQNARESAESYLDTGGFSRSGLIKQLKFEGYSKADASHAIDAIDPDWDKQAAKSAESYMDSGSFSRSGLLKQLKFEGFTATQASHGVQTVY